MSNILLKCDMCQKHDKKYYRTIGFVIKKKPSERIGCDILENTPKVRIIMAMDYFSRFLFARVLSSKHSEKVIKFLKYVYERIQIRKLVVDNGREFNNELISQWTLEKGIEMDCAVPYYHESNGRIERANRTIRQAIKKTA